MFSQVFPCLYYIGWVLWVQSITIYFFLFFFFFFFFFFSRCEKCFRNMVFITTCQNNAEESCFQVMGGYNYGWGGYSSVGGVGGVYMILATYLLYDIYHTLWWVWSCLTFHTFPKCSYITILYIYPGVWPDLTDLPRGCDRIWPMNVPGMFLWPTLTAFFFVLSLFIHFFIFHKIKTKKKT